MNANLRRNLKAVELMVKKYSPEILTGLGIAMGVTGAVVACKKSIEIKEKLKPITYLIDDIKEDASEKQQPVNKKELTNAYGKAGLIIAKEYAPAVALGTASIACILAANGIMKKRNAGLAAAYSLLDNAFQNYRNNVKASLGEEKDYNFLHGLSTVDVTREEEDPETGKKKKVKEKVEISNQATGLSCYSVIFEEPNKNFKPYPALNQSFLKGVQTWANTKLARDGYLFLGDVYEALGFEPYMLSKEQREASRVVGWIYDENYGGDTYIKFGIFDQINALANEAALDNDGKGEPTYIIDFNVDGYILDIFTSGPRTR